jgi:hypothetical protein
VFKQKGLEQVGIKQGIDKITFTAGVQNFPKLSEQCQNSRHHKPDVKQVLH